jgi:hypothetical protein
MDHSLVPALERQIQAVCLCYRITAQYLVHKHMYVSITAVTLYHYTQRRSLLERKAYAIEYS